MKSAVSEALYEEACQVLPGGVSRNTIFRTPHPFYADKASGCRVLGAAFILWIARRGRDISSVYRLNAISCARGKSVLRLMVLV